MIEAFVISPNGVIMFLATIILWFTAQKLIKIDKNQNELFRLIGELQKEINANAIQLAELRAEHRMNHGGK